MQNTETFIKVSSEGSIYECFDKIFVAIPTCTWKEVLGFINNIINEFIVIHSVHFTDTQEIDRLYKYLLNKIDSIENEKDKKIECTLFVYFLRDWILFGQYEKDLQHRIDLGIMGKNNDESSIDIKGGYKYLEDDYGSGCEE